MKKLLLTASFAACFFIVHAQKITYSLNLNSGFSGYHGNGVSSPRGITLGGPMYGFSNAPGKNSGFSYELAVSGQRVSRRGWIYGLELGYQRIQTRSDISVISPSLISSAIFTATGSSVTTNTFLAITAFGGYRIPAGKFSFDLKTGFEYAPNLTRKEHITGMVTNSGQKIDDSHDLPKKSDMRVRFLLTSSIGKWGLNTGYSLGLCNYFESPHTDDPKAYSDFLRLGVSYNF
ncbi:hypothetical protein [Sediminibacterium ginsengisoli]|uniref:Outer membrane protein beta-barrel domain-containing protein n=1 Tax=Sediminibacterium ginsengisoli TaxID=413434 RepID=A0A1T4RVJ5_9BACT|nr:hypothetical protein [Sediminibacterium ginsengisoli]SKA20019.1 hypothetical protein SAMN04488132_11542 [Sediminibacterium ginsengisoli]